MPYSGAPRGEARMRGTHAGHGIIVRALAGEAQVRVAELRFGEVIAFALRALGDFGRPEALSRRHGTQCMGRPQFAVCAPLSPNGKRCSPYVCLAKGRDLQAGEVIFQVGRVKARRRARSCILPNRFFPSEKTSHVELSQ